MGYKSIRTSEFDNEVSVYYPIDKSYYTKNADKAKPLYWIDRKLEEHQMIGMSRSLRFDGRKVKKVPEFIYRFLKDAKIDVI